MSNSQRYVWVCRTEGVGEWEPSYFQDGVECAFHTKREAREFLRSWEDTDSTLLRVHVSETARQEVAS